MWLLTRGCVGTLGVVVDTKGVISSLEVWWLTGGAMAHKVFWCAL